MEGLAPRALFWGGQCPLGPELAPSARHRRNRHIFFAAHGAWRFPSGTPFVGTPKRASCDVHVPRDLARLGPTQLARASSPPAGLGRARARDDAPRSSRGSSARPRPRRRCSCTAIRWPRPRQRRSLSLPRPFVRSDVLTRVRAASCGVRHPPWPSRPRIPLSPSRGLGGDVPTGVRAASSAGATFCSLVRCCSRSLFRSRSQTLPPRPPVRPGPPTLPLSPSPPSPTAVSAAISVEATYPHGRPVVSTGGSPRSLSPHRGIVRRHFPHGRPHGHIHGGDVPPVAIPRS